MSQSKLFFSYIELGYVQVQWIDEKSFSYDVGTFNLLLYELFNSWVHEFQIFTDCLELLFFNGKTIKMQND